MASPPVSRSRPRSPHLFSGPFALHYKWGPAMLVSILHRACGSTTATVGTLLLVWWLIALAAGPAAYGVFVDTFTVASGGLNVLGYVVGIGLTFALFQHMMSGIRHLVLDTGAAYELKVNKLSAVLTMLFSVALTVVFWLYLGVK